MAERTTSYPATPNFVVDPATAARSSGRQVDWANVPDTYRGAVEYTVTADGAANAGATAITVDALPVAIPSGAILDFTGAGELALVTADAAAGATSLTVEALDAGIEDNDTATYTTMATETYKTLPAGKFMAEQNDGTIIPMDSDAVAALDATHILVTPAVENSRSDAATGYGTFTGGAFYENLLPDNGDANFDTWKSEFAAAGPGARFETYANDAS